MNEAKIVSVTSLPEYKFLLQFSQRKKNRIHSVVAL